MSECYTEGLHNRVANGRHLDSLAIAAVHMQLDSCGEVAQRDTNVHSRHILSSITHEFKKGIRARPKKSDYSADPTITGHPQ